MTADETLTLLDTLLPPGTLNTVKMAVFKRAWEGEGYAVIADAEGYDPDYIKIAASQLWKAISKAVGQRVTKKNFRSILRQHFHPLDATAGFLNKPQTAKPTKIPPSQVKPPQSPIPQVPAYCDWGEAPDVTSSFYGRVEELVQLQRWANRDQCRLIALLGMGGIGKTALVTKLAETLKPDFDYVVWRSLRNAPELSDVLKDIVSVISGQQEAKGTQRQLLQALQSSRCLVVLDNLETLLQAGQTGQYRAGYEDYGELLRLLGESRHRSFVVITSREKPPEIAAFEGDDTAVRSLNVVGSLQVAKTILTAQAIQGSDPEKERLCEHYCCSPLALKIISTSIRDLFDGNLTEFLAQNITAFNGIRRLLDEQFSRISPLEKTVLTWLAINREGTSIVELHQDILPVVPKHELLSALEALTWRSLVEKQKGTYSLQPLVMEYITDALTEQLNQELLNLSHESSQAPTAVTTMPCFCSYALQKNTVKAHLRESQKHLVLAPIAERLSKAFPTTDALTSHFSRLIESLHQLSLPGYGPGNFINLCNFLGLDLTGYDFSSFPIQHADLRNTALHNVNFANASFSKSAFYQTLASVHKVIFSPNGQLLATADSGGGVNLWRVSDGLLESRCEGHEYWLWALAFDVQGHLLASGGEDGVVRLWEIATGICLKTLTVEMPAIWSLAFSPDGQWLAIGGDQDIHLWNWQSGHCQTLAGHTDTVRALQFSTDGNLLVSGSHDHTAKIWHWPSNTCQHTLVGHDLMLYAVALSSDAGMVATGSADRTVRLWDVATGQCLHILRGHQKIVTDLAFHPHQPLLASSSEDSSVRLWNAEEGHCQKILQGHRTWVWSVDFSPTGDTLASGGADQSVRLWNMQTGNNLKALVGYIDYLHAMDWSLDGRRLVTGGPRQRVRIWDVETGTLIHAWKAHSSWIFSLAYSPDHRMIATTSASLKLWDAESATCLRTFRNSDSLTLCVTWSPDGERLATGSTDGTVSLWDMASGRCDLKLEGHFVWVLGVVWHPTGEAIASCGIDGTVRIWHPKTGDCLHTLQTDGWVWSVAWSPDGSLFSYSTALGTVELWDARTYKHLTTLTGHTHQVTQIRFHPDGKRLVSSSYDHTVKLWDTSTGNCLLTLAGHTKLVMNVRFSPDGQQLASSSEDETARIWNVSTGECVRILQAPRPYEGMTISGVVGLTEAQNKALAALGAVGI